MELTLGNIELGSEFGDMDLASGFRVGSRGLMQHRAYDDVTDADRAAITHKDPDLNFLSPMSLVSRSVAAGDGHPLPHTLHTSHLEGT